nr:hypothetical protein [Tanacetum cinerariifolium]
MNDIDYHTSARKLVYIQSPLHSNSERPTTAMLPIFPPQQIPNTLIAGIETHTETPFTYKVPVDANWAKTTVSNFLSLFPQPRALSHEIGPRKK